MRIWLLYGCMVWYAHAMEKEPYTITPITDQFGTYKLNVEPKCVAFSSKHHKVFLPAVDEDSVCTAVYDSYFFKEDLFLYPTVQQHSVLNTNTHQQCLTSLEKELLLLKLMLQRPKKHSNKTVYDDRHNLFFVSQQKNRGLLLAYTLNDDATEITKKTVITPNEYPFFADLAVLPAYGLATASWNKCVKIWDIEAATCAHTIPLEYPSEHILPLDNHTFLTTQDWLWDQDAYIHCWDIRTKSCIQTYVTPQDLQAITINQEYIFSGEYDYEMHSNRMQQWDRRMGAVCRSYAPKKELVEYDIKQFIGIGAYKSYLIALMKTGMINIWNTQQQLDKPVQHAKVNTHICRQKISPLYDYYVKKIVYESVGCLLALDNGTFLVFGENYITKLALTSYEQSKN